jgi:hypothetical protein
VTDTPLYDLFSWLGETAAGRYLTESTVAFAVVQSLHIIGLSVFGGSTRVSSLAVLGTRLHLSDPTFVSRGLRPLLRLALGMTVLSGVLLVAAGPLKYYTNPLFPLKLLLLVFGASVQWLTYRIAAQRGRSTPVKLAALTSLAIWTSAVIAGRWLGLI